MADRIFLIGKDEQLIALESTDFVTEDRFQQLLAEHPELLNGDGHIEPESSSWLLIAREQGVPDAGRRRLRLPFLYSQLIHPPNGNDSCTIFLRLL